MGWVALCFVRARVTPFSRRGSEQRGCVSKGHTTEARGLRVCAALSALLFQECAKSTPHLCIASVRALLVCAACFAGSVNGAGSERDAGLQRLCNGGLGCTCLRVTAMFLRVHCDAQNEVL